MSAVKWLYASEFGPPPTSERISLDIDPALEKVFLGAVLQKLHWLQDCDLQDALQEARVWLRLSKASESYDSARSPHGQIGWCYARSFASHYLSGGGAGKSGQDAMRYQKTYETGGEDVAKSAEGALLDEYKERDMALSPLNPEPSQGKADALEALAEALAALEGAPEHELLVAHFYEGRMLKTLAKEKGVSPAAMSYRLSRAVAKLKSAFIKLQTPCFETALPAHLPDENATR